LSLLDKMGRTDNMEEKGGIPKGGKKRRERTGGVKLGKEEASFDLPRNGPSIPSVPKENRAVWETWGSGGRMREKRHQLSSRNKLATVRQ